MKEIWKDVVGYEGYYQVSNLGNVKSLDRVINTKQGLRNINGRLLKPANQKGYEIVPLHAKELGYNQKTVLVHHLVAEAFLNHKTCREIVVDHINYIKNDNRLVNLQIISQRENINRSRSDRFKSKLRGASWNKRLKKWKCEVYFAGKRHFFGYFKTEVECHETYKIKLRELESK